MAEYIRLPKNSLIHKVPKEMPVKDALLIEPYACSKHCVDRAQINGDDIVVISGAWHEQVAKLLFFPFSFFPSSCLLVFLSFSYYAYLVEPEFIFVPSAFKHGVTQEDIYHAYKTMILKGLLEGYYNKCAFVGFNRAGNPIEVFYNPIGDDTIKVFHAMGCQSSTIAQIE